MPAYEVDLWGKIRRANEAARARLLATQDAQRTVRQTLVAQVATAYLDLLELDYELEIAQRTYQVRTNSLALTAAREEGGVAAMQDVAQAKILVYGAEASIVDIQRQREQQENALCILLGRNPGSIQRGEGFTAPASPRRKCPPACPRRCWSAARTSGPPNNSWSPPTRTSARPRRPSIPQLTLTGFYGYQTVALSDLFTSGVADLAVRPGRHHAAVHRAAACAANLKITQAQYEEALAAYQKTVQNAFREVSDSLIAYQRTREFRARQEERTQANREATDLANIRYDGGVTSYLEVLYNEQELFTAELNLAQARLNELLTVVHSTAPWAAAGRHRLRRLRPKPEVAEETGQSNEPALEPHRKQRREPAHRRGRARQTRD